MSSMQISCDRCGIRFVYARPSAIQREHLAICPGCGHENHPAAAPAPNADADADGVDRQAR